jgi:hypothetical protein
VALPESLFIKAIETAGLDQIVVVLQQQQATVLDKWMVKYNLHQERAGRYHKGITLMVLEDKEL